MSTYYFLPTRGVLGEGAVQEAGELVKSSGAKKCLIVTDKYLGKIGMADRIQETLKKVGVEASILAGAKPSPTDKNVEAGAILCQGNRCDSIISLGGGSSHDYVKGIGPVAANGGKIAGFEGVDKSSGPMVPLMAVNTAAGTVSGIARFCIITDTSRKVRMTIVDQRVTPQIAINDLELMKGMPPALTASIGMDVLTHAVEAYVSTNANPLTDAAAIISIRVTVHYLLKVVVNGNYMKAKDKTTYTQYLAGIALNNALLGCIHAMAHQLGGFYNLPHGVCSATLLPYVENYNLVGNMNHFRDMAQAMDVQVEGISVTHAAEKAIEAIEKLSRRLGIPSDLKQLGVREKDFGIMTDNAKKDVCQLTNPRTTTGEQVTEIYRQAYVGE